MEVEPKDWTTEYFLSNKGECFGVLDDPNILNKIPSLNNTSLDNFKNGQLVQFKGMVQDMHNPEIYVQNFAVVNKDTGVSTPRCGMYVDIAHCERNEYISLEPSVVQNGERQVWFIISIPGLNGWVTEEKISTAESASCSSTIKSKRSFDDIEESMDCSEPLTKKEKVNGCDTVDGGPSPMSNTKETKAGSIVSKDHVYNFPIPIENGKACIVKIYDDVPYKLNQIVNVIGFLSLDPILGSAGITEETDNELEMQTCNPPASLVPRLHAIKILSDNDTEIPNYPNVAGKIESIRSDLKMVISQLLFGDALAADYLICHLISAVYLRKDSLCLGSFPLNITNFPVPKHQNFPKDIYDILTKLVLKSHYLDFNLENLNDMALVPKKDYECNRLTSGILQLSNNTHLVIDETSLKPGEVSAFGRQNYKAMTDLIQFQKIAYDFNYYTVEYETDIPILIFSEVKSFIPCDVRVVLKPDEESLKLYPHVCEAAKQFLKDEERIKNIRQYLHVLKSKQFEINDEMANIIQGDFVKIRQSDRNFTADNLHSLMVLARLMSLSYGLNTLMPEMWKRSIEMETERINRLPKPKT